jgi:dTDP-4-amino-4,6-dideoxygalactose transaminase
VFSDNFSRYGYWDDAVVPSNRLETRNWDLLAALACFFRHDPLATLPKVFQDLCGHRDILFTPSGRCAIAQLLSSLPQREVVMPAYLCHAVKSAAMVAGKRIIYVDVAKNSVNATSVEFAEEAKPGRILLVPHVWGVPTDIEAICKLAKSRDCVTIEDAVAVFGGRSNGRLLGTFGDFGIFSFEQSKRISAFRGGAIIVNNAQILDTVKLRSSRLIDTKRVMPIGEMVQALAQNLATIPWIYRTISLRLLSLRGIMPMLMERFRNVSTPVCATEQRTVPRAPCYTREIHPYQAELVLRMLSRMDDICTQIKRLANIYQETFQNTPIATFVPLGYDNGGLIRYPIAFPRKNRDVILRLARERGLYIKVFWPQLLTEESEYSRFPNAAWAARNLVLLPLYTALSPKSAELLAQNVLKIERNAPAI